MHCWHKVYKCDKKGCWNQYIDFFAKICLNLEKNWLYLHSLSFNLVFVLGGDVIDIKIEIYSLYSITSRFQANIADIQYADQIYHRILLRIVYDYSFLTQFRGRGFLFRQFKTPPGGAILCSFSQSWAKILRHSSDHKKIGHSLEETKNLRGLRLSTWELSVAVSMCSVLGIEIQLKIQVKMQLNGQNGLIQPTQPNSTLIGLLILVRETFGHSAVYFQRIVLNCGNKQ